MYPQWAKGARTELRLRTLAPAIFPPDPGASSGTQTAKLGAGLDPSVQVSFLKQQHCVPRIPMFTLLCSQHSGCKLQACYILKSRGEKLIGSNYFSYTQAISQGHHAQERQNGFLISFLIQRNGPLTFSLFHSFF